MTPKEQRDFLQMYVALRTILAYQSAQRLLRSGEKQYGIDGAEALEYAYENIQGEAKAGLKSVRKPKEQ